MAHDQTLGSSAAPGSGGLKGIVLTAVAVLGLQHAARDATRNSAEDHLDQDKGAPSAPKASSESSSANPVARCASSPLTTATFSCDIARPVSPPGPRSANGERRLSRRVEKVVGYPPLRELDDGQRLEFHEALLEADAFEGLPGKWQAAIGEAEQSRPDLRVVGSDSRPGR